MWRLNIGRYNGLSISILTDIKRNSIWRYHNRCNGQSYKLCTVTPVYIIALQRLCTVKKAVTICDGCVLSVIAVWVYISCRCNVTFSRHSGTLWNGDAIFSSRCSVTVCAGIKTGVTGHHSNWRPLHRLFWWHHSGSWLTQNIVTPCNGLCNRCDGIVMASQRLGKYGCRMWRNWVLL
jgi:hypothetical protein